VDTAGCHYHDSNEYENQYGLDLANAGVTLPQDAGIIFGEAPVFEQLPGLLRRINGAVERKGHAVFSQLKKILDIVWQSEGDLHHHKNQDHPPDARLAQADANTTSRAESLSHMNKVLTRAISEQFLTNPSSVGIRQFTMIDDDAAEVISQYPKDWLQFDGLTTLSDSAAENFSKYQGSLSLGGLTSITDASAKSLSKLSGSLHLGLTNLTDAAADSLGNHNGELRLHNLKSLSDRAAVGLGRHRGLLDLRGLTALTDATAASLSQNQGNLILLGLTTLSEAAARSLGQCPGYLMLGLTELSDAAADGLSQHRGDCLYFPGLTSLSDTSAECFCKHEKTLYLSGLTILSDSDARILASIVAHNSTSTD
jgi:hypothetical protein